MPASLLEILRSIPDHRRAEGKRFYLATVVLYSILGMVAVANSYRQMHEFIRVHLQRLNGAFGLRLPYSPSYTGLRLIIQGVIPRRWRPRSDSTRPRFLRIFLRTVCRRSPSTARRCAAVSTPSATARRRT